MYVEKIWVSIYLRVEGGGPVQYITHKSSSCSAEAGEEGALVVMGRACLASSLETLKLIDSFDPSSRKLQVPLARSTGHK